MNYPSSGRGVATGVVEGGCKHIVTDGLMASSVLATEQYDLVTLDLCLPGMDGLEVLEKFRSGHGAVRPGDPHLCLPAWTAGERFRRGNRDTPVLILTIRGRLNERVRGLDLGADDYMTKPFEIAEFEARVRCLLRRRDGLRTNVIEFGPLSFNTAERTVVLDDDAVDLTRRERSLLEILLFRAGRVVPKKHIHEHLCSFDEDVGASAIDTYIHRLRRKIDHPRLGIRTIRGLGYMLDHA